MSNLYIVLIVFPVIIFLVLDFVFQSSLSNTDASQYLINCPLPIDNGIATLGLPQFVGDTINYTTSYGSSNQTDKGTFFQCTVTGSNPPLFGALLQQKPYGAALGSCSTFCIPYGYIAYFGDTVWVIGGKLQPALALIYIYATAPAQVTGMAWFNYVDLFLFFLVAIGIVGLIRGI